MPTTHITNTQIASYAAHLKREERAGATIEKYTRDIRVFAAWLDGAAVTKDAAVAYKEHLTQTRAPAGANAPSTPTPMCARRASTSWRAAKRTVNVLTASDWLW